MEIHFIWRVNDLRYDQTLLNADDVALGGRQQGAPVTGGESGSYKQTIFRLDSTVKPCYRPRGCYVL
jgi:hypothetical protein